jgi:D-serine deaminase-like pyridoxal phosphate-dependent protein
VARRQIAEGAKGITCAKLGEAEDLVQAGIGDVLIANQVVDPGKIARLAYLAKCCRLSVCVDDITNCETSRRRRFARARPSTAWWSTTWACGAAARAPRRNSSRWRGRSGFGESHL